MVGATVIGSLAGGVTNSVLNNARGTASGSLVVQGDTYYVTNNAQQSDLSNENPSLRVNSGSALTFATSGDTPGGGILFTQSGSDNYHACAQVPSKYSSGAILERADLECDRRVGKNFTGSLVLNLLTPLAALSTGNSVRHHIGISSGVTLAINTGAMMNTKVAASKYICFIGAASGANALPVTVDCDLKLRLHEKYGR